MERDPRLRGSRHIAARGMARRPPIRGARVGRQSTGGHAARRGIERRRDGRAARHDATQALSHARRQSLPPCPQNPVKGRSPCKSERPSRVHERCKSVTFHTVAAFVRLLRVAAGLRVALRRKCDFPAQGQKEAYLARGPQPITERLSSWARPRPANGAKVP